MTTVTSVPRQTDRQRLIGDSIAQFCAGEHSPQRIRACRDRTPDFDRDLWRRLANLGWLGIIVPEEAGGLGLEFSDLAAMLLPWGEACAPEPFVATTVLCGGAILNGNGPARTALLHELCGGGLIAALAWSDRKSGIPRVSAELRGENFVIDGDCTVVVPADADGWLVSAQSSDGAWLIWVDAETSGAGVSRERRADGSFAARLTFSQCIVGAENMVATPDIGAEVLDRSLDQARIAVSVEMVGMARRMLAMTLEYLKMREQFGQPIGKFQVLQHRAVDMFVSVELAQDVVLAAARAVDSGINDRELGIWASRAKARATEVLGSIARDAVQLHGAIGFSDEYPLGIYVNRSLVYCAWLGNHSFHVDRYARLCEPYQSNFP